MNFLVFITELGQALASVHTSIASTGIVLLMLLLVFCCCYSVLEEIDEKDSFIIQLCRVSRDLLIFLNISFSCSLTDVLV